MANERPDRTLPEVERIEEDLERSGRHRELADWLEAQLAADPPLSGRKAEAARLRLATICEEHLHDPGRALGHVEVLLAGDAVTDEVFGLARRFMEQRSTAPRVAALLSDAYRRLERASDEIEMLTRELRLARLPRLVEVQHRLAMLRQDVLGDVVGATELHEQQMIRDPGDDESRRRFVANSILLGRTREAAHLLSRVWRNTHGDAQARVGVDIGQLYAKDGDFERARRAFAQVVEMEGDVPARLVAARRLLDERSGPTPRTLIRPLAIVAEHETDAAARAAAATELLELRGRARLDARSEIAAWRALLDGPRVEEALTALEALYEASGNRVELAGVLELRAKREPDPAAAQTLSWRAAEMCSAHSADPEVVLSCWRRYVARYGPSRQAHARMIPLLERTKSFIELAKVLADEVELTPELQRATILGRLGEVRLRHLSDTKGAVELFRQGLALSTRESRSRGCLEELLAHDDWALSAGEVLEPLYRSEFSSSERARHMLVKLLGLRAERAVLVGDRLQASTELGEMHESAGQRSEALKWYERAWSLEPRRTELLGRIDMLAEQEGQSPELRLERYVAAVHRVEEPARRAELWRAIGTLEHSRGDVRAAIVTWQRALEAEPAHFEIHEMLLGAYGELGESNAAMEELRRALPHFTGHQRHVTLVRIGQALAARGAHAEALALCRPLLNETTLDDALFAALERFAEDAEDVGAARLVFERAVTVAPDPQARARALERLADFLDGWAGDTAEATRCWRAAADEYMKLAGKASEALRLLERVLDHTQNDVEPAKHLLELYLEAGEWSRMPEVYALLLRRSDDPTPAIELLLSLESSAVLAGAANEFSELVENALWRLSDLTSPLKHSLIAARARVFASAGRHVEAADVYRTLLELHADERDASDFQTLIDSSPPGDFRRDNQRWLFAWRVDAATGSASALADWARAEETQFGDKQAAISLWERAALSDPTRIEIWEALVRLKIDAGDVEGGLDAVQPLRGLLNDEARIATERRLAETLIERLHRTDRALPLLASVLEKSPSDAAARELTFGIVRSASSLRTRAAELLEHASGAVDPTQEQRALLEQLLEATSDAGTGDPTPLSLARRRWFERLFELTRGESSFAVVERAALEYPGDDAIWQRLELLSCQLEDPGRAVRAYGNALERPTSGEIAEMLGRRLVAFAEDRAQHPQVVTAALERVLALSPGARWAVDRVKLVLASERRWPELFALYERAADAATDPTERADLLDEAAIAARDVAGDLDRAIECWERVILLRPGDTRLDLTLERLYERRGLTAKLIHHLLRRAESQSGAPARLLRERAAALWLDLSNGAAALELVEPLLTEDPGSATAHGLLERVLSLGSQGGDAATDDARSGNATAGRRAGELLKQRYAKAGRGADLARVLERELATTTTPAERIERLKALFELRMGELGDRSNALECLGELVALEPAAAVHREKLAELAAELGAHERMSQLLVTAADRLSGPDAIELLRRAAEVRAAHLSDAKGAADLYLRILSEPCERDAQAAAARALYGLLDAIVEPARRCDVLEQVAALDAGSPSSRTIALEAARVALEELGDGDRAIRNLRPLVDRGADDRDVRDRFVQALRAAGNYAELADTLAARAEISEASQARRDWVELAHVCSEHLSAPQRAIQVWCDVRRRFGRDQESFEALARLFESRGQWQELASLLADEARSAVTPRELFRRLGDVHRDHTGDARAAVEAYLAGGDPERALRTLEGDERLLFKEPALCVEVAAALGGDGRLGDAESLLLRHLEHQGRRRAKEQGAVHCELARVLRASGREKEALERLATAAELYPTDPAILSALARTSFDGGNLERAEKAYQALLLLLLHSSDGHGAGTSRAEVYVELHELALRRDDPSRARDLMASALEAALESEDERRGLERALRRRAKLDVLENAMETYAARVATPKAAVGALAALVGLQRERGTLEEARVAQMIERADRLRRELGPKPSEPSELEAFEKLVEVYTLLEQAEQAVELLDVMSAANAGGAEDSARFGLEAARLLVDVPFRRDEAAARLQVIWKANRARTDVALLLSRALEEEGHIEEALAVHRSQPPEPGREKDTLEAIVRLEQARGAEPACVAEALEQLLALEQGSRRAEAARRLSALYKAVGDAAAVERVLVVGVAADATRSDLRDELVELYLARGAHAQAAAALEGALEASPDAPLRWRVSELHQKAGDTRAALRVLDFVPTSRPEKAQLSKRRSILLEESGRTEEALNELEAAYHLDARHGPDLLAAIVRTTLAASSERWALLAADLSIRYGEPTKGRQTLVAWLEANPKCRPALRRLAKLATRERDLSTAIDAYRRLSSLDTGEARRSAVLELAKACDAAGRAAEALANVEAALADAPKDVELGEWARKLRAASPPQTDRRPAATPRKPAQALIEQARKHLADDELVEAFDSLSQAHRLDKSDTQVSFLLGLLAVDLDRVEDASAALRAFVSTRAHDGETTGAGPSPVSRAYFHLAVIEHARGDDGAARRMASRAIEESPNNRDARRLLSELRPSTLGS